MATETAAPTSTTPEGGAPDTGNGDADVDAQLASFMVDSDGEEVSETPTDDEAAAIEAGAPKEEGEEEEVEGETKEEKPEEKPVEELKWEVKINGETFEVDEKELIRGYQMGQAAQAKFQEASVMRGQTEKLLGVLKSDPLKILLNPALGINFRELAENYLVEQLRMEQADPATKAQMMAEAKLKELQAKEDAIKSQEEERQMAMQTEQFRVQIDKQFTEALTKGKVPKTPTVVKRMAELASQMLDQGYDPEADELVDLVRKEIIQATRELSSGMNAEELEATLGKEKMDDLRKARVAAAAKPAKPSIKQFKPTAQTGPRKYISERELKADIDKALGRSR